MATSKFFYGHFKGPLTFLLINLFYFYFIFECKIRPLSKNSGPNSDTFPFFWWGYLGPLSKATDHLLSFGTQ